MGEKIARTRVAQTLELAQYESIIFYDWPDWDDHLEWLETAPTSEIVDWVEAIVEQDLDLYTDDRTRQVNWLREFAGNLVQNTTWGEENTASEIASMLDDQEFRESWGIHLPVWYDDHDRNLLTEMIEELL